MKVNTISSEQFPVLSYAVYGAGSPIVLLHGFPFDRLLWDEVARELSGRYRVIVPDLPGSGQSTFSGEELSIDDMAKSVSMILQTEGIGKALIAGHSLGGYVAVAFAGLYPEMLSGIGFIHSFATPDTEEKKEQRRKSIALFKKGGKDLFIRQMIPSLFSPDTREGLEKEINELIERSLLTSDKSMIAFYNAMINRPDRTAILYNNNLPVLWIIGADDNIATTKNLMQQTSLANVNFVYIYNKCGHMSMIEAKEKLSVDLNGFAAYCFSTSGSN